MVEFDEQLFRQRTAPPQAREDFVLGAFCAEFRLYDCPAFRYSLRSMDRATARTIADALTWARIFSVIPITVCALYELRWWVFGLYIAAGISDNLDGRFARMGDPPRSDVDLDNLADTFIAAMTLVWIWMLIPGFWEKYWLPYIPSLFGIQLWLWLTRYRYPALGTPHFQVGRYMMALFFFLLPVLIAFGDVEWFVHAVLIGAVIGKLRMVWYYVTTDRTALDKQAATK